MMSATFVSLAALAALAQADSGVAQAVVVEQVGRMETEAQAVRTAVQATRAREEEATEAALQALTQAIRLVETAAIISKARVKVSEERTALRAQMEQMVVAVADQEATTASLD
jgi:hypothetical protein